MALSMGTANSGAQSLSRDTANSGAPRGGAARWYFLSVIWLWGIGWLRRDLGGSRWGQRHRTGDKLSECAEKPPQGFAGAFRGAPPSGDLHRMPTV